MDYETHTAPLPFWQHHSISSDCFCLLLSKFTKPILTPGPLFMLLFFGNALLQSTQSLHFLQVSGQIVLWVKLLLTTLCEIIIPLPILAIPSPLSLFCFPPQHVSLVDALNISLSYLFTVCPLNRIECSDSTVYLDHRLYIISI